MTQMKNTPKNYRETFIIDTTTQRYPGILRSMAPKTANLYRTTFSGLLIKVFNASDNYLQKYTKCPTASK